MTIFPDLGWPLHWRNRSPGATFAIRIVSSSFQEPSELSRGSHETRNAARIRHGLVLTCIGDAGGFHYKKSRRGNAEIDRAAAQVLRHYSESHEIMEFSPYGYDERQYCSPGFNLPVGCLMRSVWGTFPEYHTSADNLEFINPLKLAASLRVCTAIVDVLENNRRYRNLNPYGEPQLGRRNLYRAIGGEAIGAEIHARFWVLNFSDGEHTLLDISERSGLPFAAIAKQRMSCWKVACFQ